MSMLRRYLIAVGAIAAAVFVARAVDPWVAPHVTGPYFLAVMLVAAYAGAGPGLFATVLASSAIAWFDLGTTHRFDLGFDDLLRLSIFSVTALVISSISAARKTAESELRVALEELSALDRAKDEFIATVSHELRTPLTSILGWLQLLRAKNVDDTTRELALESIEQSARTQSMLVSDMLDASRIVLGKLHLELEPLSFSEVVHDAIAVIGPDAEAKGIRIEVEVPNATAIVRGDRQRLKQVVWNLLGNAIKFTSENRKIRIRVDHDEKAAIVEVADEGDGIDPELLAHLFDRFTQGHGSVRKGGLGLGLSIVRHIVELHGGTVTAFSAGRGQGSTFAVKLPRHCDSDDEQEVSSG